MIVKKAATLHLPKKRNTEPKWFEKQIFQEDFEIKQDKNGKYYAKHKEWKKNIWIGPYETNDDVEKVIASYVSISKKPFGNRKELKNVHSIIVENKDL